MPGMLIWYLGMALSVQKKIYMLIVKIAVVGAH